MMKRQDSYLSTEEIEQCALFAAESWTYHRPNNMRKRAPVQVWYDILKGKLAEVTLHNYCKFHEISTSLEYPSFDIIGRDSAISSHKSQLHDLAINNRRKELKSGEHWYKYITLKSSYFENGQYKYGEPDDIIFVSISLCGLSQAKILFKEAISEQKKDDPDGILHRNELLSHTFHSKGYECDRQTFMDDCLVRAAVRECNLKEIGFRAATEKRKSKGKKASNEEANKGKFTVLGEMPISSFLKVARLVKPKYIHSLPEDPMFHSLARDYMGIVGKPINKELSFESFVHRNFRIKKFDESTFVWLEDNEEKPSKQLEESGANLEELKSIRQVPYAEYVITPIELRPLERSCQIDKQLPTSLSLSQKVKSTSKTKIITTLFVAKSVKAKEKLPILKIKGTEENFSAKQDHSPSSPQSTTTCKPILRNRRS